MKNQSYDALMEAARIAGSQAKAASLCGKKQAHFQKWLNSPIGVPAEYCPDLEQGTGVLCERLRPDLAQQWRYLRESGRILAGALPLDGTGGAASSSHGAMLAIMGQPKPL